MSRSLSARWRFGVPLALSAAVCAFCVLLGAVAPSAGARPVKFGPPTLLEAGAIEGVAINAKGEALAVWRRDRVLRVASRRADGRWARPVTLDRGRACRNYFRLAINARGDAVLAWTQNHGCHEGPEPELLVSMRTARRGWSRPEAIDRTWASSLALGITERGVAVLAWQDGRSIWTTSRPGTRWRAPTLLRQTPASVSELAVDVHPTGWAVAMWGETLWDVAAQTAGSSQIMVSTRAPTGEWAPASSIPGTEGLVSTWSGMPMRVSGTRDGEILGAWATEAALSPVPAALQVIEYRPSAGWSPPRTLASPAGNLVRFSLDMNDRGEAVVGWSGLQPFAATRTSGGAWSTPQRLSSLRPEISAWAVEVAVSGDGSIFATWPLSEAFAGGGLGMRAATGTAGSGWRERLIISHRGNDGLPQLAVADGPRAIIGWNQRTGTSGKVTQRVGVAITR